MNTKNLDATTFKIAMRTGRFPVECSCSKCQKQCLTPCLGTPQDIRRLIKAGYIKDLSVAIWGVGQILGELSFPIFMVQPKQTEAGCVFFKGGKCAIHDTGLKPTEGMLSHHTVTLENLSFTRSLTWNVAKEWLLEKNIDVILEIVDAIAEKEKADRNT